MLSRPLTIHRVSFGAGDPQNGARSRRPKRRSRCQRRYPPSGRRRVTTWRPACLAPTVSPYVPALLGLGTPNWDFGARGTLLGVTRGTTSAHVVRAVLDGVAQRGVDLVEAAEADTGLAIDSAARRWWHEHQPDSDPGTRRPVRTCRRGRPGRRCHDPRCGRPRRARPSACGATSRTPPHCGASGRRRARRRSVGATAPAGRTPSSGRRAGFRSCPHSTSRRPGDRRPPAIHSKGPATRGETNSVAPDGAARRRRRRRLNRPTVLPGRTEATTTTRRSDRPATTSSCSRLPSPSS